MKGKYLQQVKQEKTYMKPRSFDAVLGGKQSQPKKDSAVLGGAEGFVKSLNLEMVYIPGGTFIMGSPETEAENYDDEKPQHRVTIKPFFMAKYPVTQEQYQAIMGTNPSNFKGAKRPVERVSWYDSVNFCEKLTQKTGKNYRLPSEAEWEYACRAETTTAYCFGETLTNELANFNRVIGQTTDVGKYPPNAFGLYDMHGNVWEWCADPWHDNYKGAPTDGSVWDEKENDHRYQNSVDLLVMSRNDHRDRLLRGGSWDYNPRYCRSAIRYNVAPDTRYSGYGFRFVCECENQNQQKQVQVAKQNVNDNGFFESFVTDYYD